jgi:hypothetical protein
MAHFLNFLDSCVIFFIYEVKVREVIQPNTHGQSFLQLRWEEVLWRRILLNRSFCNSLSLYLCSFFSRRFLFYWFEWRLMGKGEWLLVPRGITIFNMRIWIQLYGFRKIIFCSPEPNPNPQQRIHKSTL